MSQNSLLASSPPPVAGLSGGPAPKPCTLPGAQLSCLPPSPALQELAPSAEGQLLGVSQALFRGLTPKQGGDRWRGNDTRQLGCGCASFMPLVNAVESLLLPDLGSSSGSSREGSPDLASLPPGGRASSPRFTPKAPGCPPPEGLLSYCSSARLPGPPLRRWRPLIPHTWALDAPPRNSHNVITCLFRGSSA